MSSESNQAFEHEMKAIIAGDKKAPNATIAHFAERFKKAQDRHTEMTTGLQELEQKMAQGKVELAKILGFIENLAEDLRHLWNEAHKSPAPAPSSEPDIIAN